MQYYEIEPQVPGNIWNRSELKITGDDEIENEITKFIFSFNHADYDDIFTSTPYFFVTIRAKEKLKVIGATGVTFEKIENVVLDTDEVFDDDIYWADIVGKKGLHDIYEDQSTHLLCVSQRVLDCLKTLKLRDCPISRI